MQRQPATCILASRRNGTQYVGVTSNLVQRVWQHRNDEADGFTARHRVHRLVWFEVHPDMARAIAREKQLKAGSRKEKLALIETDNPAWRDLYDDLCR